MNDFVAKPAVNRDSSNKISVQRQLISYVMLIFATLFIFTIAEVIRFYLSAYELDSMFVSFCAGFILFVPFVSLLLHNLVIPNNIENRSSTKGIWANIGLVVVVQCLFFLIWITDAVAVYSIYVDQNSFLAKAFNITSANHVDLSMEYYWANLLLAWFFSWLSLAIGVLPCLVARLNNQGLVSNVVLGFSYAKQQAKQVILFALLIALSVVLPLLYAKYLFILVFPLIITLTFIQMSKNYLLTIQLESE